MTEEERERRNAHKREMYRKNREKELERCKKYREANREKINEAARKRNKEEEAIEYRKKYFQDNKDHFNEWQRNNRKKTKRAADLKWRHETNPQKYKAGSLNGQYNSSDKKRGFDISDNVSSEWILHFINNNECVYCKENNWQKLGCDRIDNSKPHTEDNVVCSCRACNVERQIEGLTVEEFKVYKKQQIIESYKRLNNLID
jgi:hypothetical protein